MGKTKGLLITVKPYHYQIARNNILNQLDDNCCKMSQNRNGKKNINPQKQQQQKCWLNKVTTMKHKIECNAHQSKYLKTSRKFISMQYVCKF